MAIHRKNSGRKSGWALASAFNALLLVIPILAAHVLGDAMRGDGSSAEPSAEALVETRRAIDRAFAEMPPRGADRRAFWADLVDRELGRRDMSAARGFLIAAPLMLDVDDSRAVNAAAAAETSGGIDQRLTRAALLFLPNDVRAAYEAASRPPAIAPAASYEQVSEDADGAENADRAAAEPPPPLDRRPRVFSLLGTEADLAVNSRAWLRGEPNDDFVLRLTGLAMAASDLDVDGPALFADQAREAASILKAARRAGRLQRPYARHLEARLDEALPEDVLRPALELVFDAAAPLSDLADMTRTAYGSSIDADAARRFAGDLDDVARLAEATSASGAITLIELVRAPHEMRQVRLIAEAGGVRAIALAKQSGRDALKAAESGIKWTRLLVFQVIALAAGFMALCWLALIGVARSFRPARARFSL